MPCIVQQTTTFKSNVDRATARGDDRSDNYRRNFAIRQHHDLIATKKYASHFHCGLFRDTIPINKDMKILAHKAAVDDKLKNLPAIDFVTAKTITISSAIQKSQNTQVHFAFDGSMSPETCTTYSTTWEV